MTVSRLEMAEVAEVPVMLQAQMTSQERYEFRVAYRSEAGVYEVVQVLGPLKHAKGTKDTKGTKRGIFSSIDGGTTRM